MPVGAVVELRATLGIYPFVLFDTEHLVCVSVDTGAVRVDALGEVPCAVGEHFGAMPVARTVFVSASRVDFLAPMPEVVEEAVQTVQHGTDHDGDDERDQLCPEDHTHRNGDAAVLGLVQLPLLEDGRGRLVVTADGLCHEEVHDGNRQKLPEHNREGCHAEANDSFQGAAFHCNTPKVGWNRKKRDFL